MPSDKETEQRSGVVERSLNILARSHEVALDLIDAYKNTKEEMEEELAALAAENERLVAEVDRLSGSAGSWHKSFLQEQDLRKQIEKEADSLREQLAFYARNTRSANKGLGAVEVPYPERADTVPAKTVDLNKPTVKSDVNPMSMFAEDSI